jgi:hypothetical protein
MHFTVGDAQRVLLDDLTYGQVIFWFRLIAALPS